jgi:hypothetical protein
VADGHGFSPVRISVLPNNEAAVVDYQNIFLGVGFMWTAQAALSVEQSVGPPNQRKP